MSSFDPRSFIIIAAVAGMLSSFIFFVLRRSCPRDIGGLSEWAWSCLLLVLSAFLFTARDALPPMLAIMAPNLALVGGLVLKYIGLRRFAGFASRYGKWLAALGLLALALLGLTLYVDSYRGRIELITVVNMTLFIACALVTFRSERGGFPEYLTAGIFLLTAAVTFLRFLAAVTGYDSPDYYHDTSLIQHIYLATYAFALIAVTLGFMLMISRRLQLRLEYSASHDDLTGAYTRAAFSDFVAKEIGRCGRHALSMSLLLIDIDNFKRINDRYGHQAGDAVIRNFVHLATSQLRDHDVLCRYGGEEFAVLLPNTGLDEALVVAERIRAGFASLVPDEVPPCTVSIGLVTARNGQGDVGQLIGSADQALYAAKKSGKDRVVAAGLHDSALRQAEPVASLA